MTAYSRYKSPLGDMIMAAEDGALTGLWFEKGGSGSRDATSPGGADEADLTSPTSKENVDVTSPEAAAQVFKETKKWLDIYFSGEEPDFTPPLLLAGSDFGMKVWEILLEIPYGVTATYGDIAKQLAKETSEAGEANVSAQAVGGAIGRNPISIIVPCHRVIGSDGSLTGYAGGLKRKKKLLELEGVFDEI